MKIYYAVIDTNVLVSALLSRNLASPTIALLNFLTEQLYHCTMTKYYMNTPKY